MVKKNSASEPKESKRASAAASVQKTAANDKDAANQQASSADPQAAQSNESGAEATHQQEAAQIEGYEQEIAGLKDKLLRSAAELENVRRRSQKEVEDAANFSISKFAKDLIGVLDNLYRAAESVPKEEAEQDPRLKSFLDGVEITKKEMINAFDRNGIQRIFPLNEKFDHNFHQAVTQVEDKNHESGTIIDVMQAGYVLKDRLLRPAMVVVVK